MIEVLQSDVPEYAEFVGQIEAPQNVEIRARVEGFVQKVDFVEGTEVQEGDLLFIIDPRQYRESLAQAKGQLGQLEAQREQAREDVERFQPLAEMQAISQQELDNAIAVEAAAEAAAEAQRAAVRTAELDLGYTVLRAPVSGRIGDKLVDVGDFVGRGEPTLMAVISTVDTVWVSFSVSEVEFLEFNREAQALGETGRERSRQLPVELLLADGSVLPHPGREREPGVAGLLYRHGGTLTGFCWLPSTALVSLVILLCDGRRIYVALDSQRLRYRRAPVHDIYWYTEGHPELEEILVGPGPLVPFGLGGR